MIPAKACIFAVERKIDRLNAEERKAVPVVSICNALNEAMRKLIKRRAPLFETEKDVSSELRELIVRDKELRVAKNGMKTIVSLPPDLYRSLGAKIKAVKSDCGVKLIELTPMSTDDAGRAMRNPFWESSYTWEQAFYNIADDRLYVMNGDDFKVETLYFDYIKNPPEVHCPSKAIGGKYTDWNGVVQTKDQGWILEDLFDEGVDVAANLLTGDMGDSNDYQLQVNKNIQSEQTTIKS